MYWRHKASTLSFAEQEVLLDAVAMSDAGSHDSQSLMPQLRRLLQRHPDLRVLVTRVLDNGAADDPQRKVSIREQFGVELLAPINSRRFPADPRRVATWDRSSDAARRAGLGSGLSVRVVGLPQSHRAFSVPRATGRRGKIGVPGLSVASGLLSGPVRRASGNDFGGSSSLAGPKIAAVVQTLAKAMARRSSVFTS